jgi:predicted nucleic acid-binding protein
MPDSKAFIDTNILLYLLSADTDKAERVQEILYFDWIISVQVLNEIANVTRRKFSLPWDKINKFLSYIRSMCSTVVPLQIETHTKAFFLAERYNLSVYDALIVAAGLFAGCTTLFSEDMQNGLLIDDQLHICNPFLIH